MKWVCNYYYFFSTNMWECEANPQPLALRYMSITIEWYVLANSQLIKKQICKKNKTNNLLQISK